MKLKESDLYSAIASELDRLARELDGYRERLRHIMPSSPDIDGIAFELTRTIEGYRKSSGIALQAAGKRRIGGGDPEVDVPDPPQHPLIKILEAAQVALPPTPGCDCEGCRKKRAAVEASRGPSKN